VDINSKWIHAATTVGATVVDVVCRGADPAAALAPLHDIAPFKAAMISARDPLTGSHRPIVVTRYDPGITGYLNSGFLRCPGYRRARLTRRALRVCDMPEFRETLTYRTYLEPRGFREGMALTLRSDGPDACVTGMLAMSFDEEPLDDGARDAIETLAPVLARLTDLRLTPDWLRSILAPASAAAVVDADGAVSPVTGVPNRPSVVLPTRLIAAIRDFLRVDRVMMCGYLEHADTWHRVHIVRLPATQLLPGPRALAMLEPTPPPSGLTPRELDVLSLVARGLRNREIADRLGVSPRTVGSHVEHILLKMRLTTRAALAGEALERGLVRITLPGSVHMHRTGPEELPSVI
jgi:DNA-binding CsgD family transcriptional regulator